jgi:hypothetical protein
MALPPTPPQDSFRVPNSLIQGLTTSTAAGLNQLSAFQTVVLFGLLAKVSSRNPEKEVQLKLSEILEVIEVGKQVAHAVDREWTTGDGETRHRRYQCRRFSPSHLQLLHKALLTLFNATVLIQRRDDGKGHHRQDLMVHLLDQFGYLHYHNGQLLDPDALPAGRTKTNGVSVAERIVRPLDAIELDKK